MSVHLAEVKVDGGLPSWFPEAADFVVPAMVALIVGLLTAAAQIVIAWQARNHQAKEANRERNHRERMTLRAERQAAYAELITASEHYGLAINDLNAFFEATTTPSDRVQGIAGRIEERLYGASAEHSIATAKVRLVGGPPVLKQLDTFVEQTSQDQQRAMKGLWFEGRPNDPIELTGIHPMIAAMAEDLRLDIGASPAPLPDVAVPRVRFARRAG